MKYMKFIYFIKGHSVLLGAISFIFLFTISFGVNVKSSKALLGFGGEILMVIPCVDEASYAIVVGTPTPGVYIWVPGTIMFQYYNLWTPGPWVLGGYIPDPFLTCSDLGVPLLGPGAIMGIIEFVGTSMMPI